MKLNKTLAGIITAATLTFSGCSNSLEEGRITKKEYEPEREYTREWTTYHKSPMDPIPHLKPSIWARKHTEQRTSRLCVRTSTSFLVA